MWILISFQNESTEEQSLYLTGDIKLLIRILIRLLKFLKNKNLTQGEVTDNFEKYF